MLIFHLCLSKFNIEGLITTSICSQNCPHRLFLSVHTHARFVIKVLRHHSHVICIVIICEIVIVSLLCGGTIPVRNIVLRLLLPMLCLVLIEVSAYS